jgi:hypothetical protein
MELHDELPLSPTTASCEPESRGLDPATAIGFERAVSASAGFFASCSCL